MKLELAMAILRRYDNGDGLQLSEVELRMIGDANRAINAAVDHELLKRQETTAPPLAMVTVQRDCRFSDACKALLSGWRIGRAAWRGSGNHEVFIHRIWRDGVERLEIYDVREPGQTKPWIVELKDMRAKDWDIFAPYKL